MLDTWEFDLSIADCTVRLSLSIHEAYRLGQFFEAVAVPAVLEPVHPEFPGWPDPDEMREHLVEYRDRPNERLAMTDDVAVELRTLPHVRSVTLVE